MAKKIPLIRFSCPSIKSHKLIVQLGLLVYLLLVNIFSAYAEGWMISGRTPEDDLISVDLSSAEVSGDSVTYWKKVNFAQRLEGGALSYKIRETANCKRKEYVIRYLMIYDDVDFNGQLIDEFANPKPLWEPIKANSIDARTMKLVCDKKLRKLFTGK